MSRLKKRISAYSSYARTEKMPPAPPRKARSRIRGSILVIVLLVDALVALPAGWMVGKNHLADSTISQPMVGLVLATNCDPDTVSVFSTRTRLFLKTNTNA